MLCVGALALYGRCDWTGFCIKRDAWFPSLAPLRSTLGARIVSFLFLLLRYRMGMTTFKGTVVVAVRRLGGSPAIAFGPLICFCIVLRVNRLMPRVFCYFLCWERGREGGMEGGGGKGRKGFPLVIVLFSLG